MHAKTGHRSPCVSSLLRVRAARDPGDSITATGTATQYHVARMRPGTIKQTQAGSITSPTRRIAPSTALARDRPMRNATPTGTGEPPTCPKTE